MSQRTFETYDHPTRPRPESPVPERAPYAPYGDVVAPRSRSAAGPCRSGTAVDRFVVASVLCVAIWLMTGADYFWPMWVMLGTGAPALVEVLRRRRG